MRSSTDDPALIAAIEARIGSGEPFTNGGLCRQVGVTDRNFRVVERVIQRWRRRGLIAFTREGRGIVVWRLTEKGKRRNDPPEPEMAGAPNAPRPRRGGEKVAA